MHGWMPAILKVALACNLDVVPRELLANPLIARVGHHLQLPIALGRFYLLLKKRVDPEHADFGFIGYGVSGGVRHRADEVRRVIDQAARLRQQVLLAGNIEQRRADCIAREEQPAAAMSTAMRMKKMVFRRMNTFITKS